jgi:hypothetical protein
VVVHNYKSSYFLFGLTIKYGEMGDLDSFVFVLLTVSKFKIH